MIVLVIGVNKEEITHFSSSLCNLVQECRIVCFSEPNSEELNADIAPSDNVLKIFKALGNLIVATAGVAAISEENYSQVLSVVNLFVQDVLFDSVKNRNKTRASTSSLLFEHALEILEIVGNLSCHTVVEEEADERLELVVLEHSFT